MSTTPTSNATGSCLCGSVRYDVDGELRPVIYCHCEQCRKTSGHYVAATACKRRNLNILADNELRWFQSSAAAERGFCQRCGSSLFWKPKEGDYVSIMAGSLARPTSLTASSHIYVHMASDYYAISDGLPQYEDTYASFYSDETE